MEKYGIVSPLPCVPLLIGVLEFDEKIVESWLRHSKTNALTVCILPEVIIIIRIELNCLTLDLLVASAFGVHAGLERP